MKRFRLIQQNKKSAITYRGLYLISRLTMVSCIAILMMVLVSWRINQVASAAGVNDNGISSVVRLIPAQAPLTASSCDYQGTVLGNNPIGYWRLDETSGTIVANISSLGSVVNGTYVGGVSLAGNGLVVAEGTSDELKASIGNQS